MDLQEIEVEISPSGQVTLHVKGVNGPACLQLTGELENLLGGQLIERRMTAEAGDTFSEAIPQPQPAIPLRRSKK